MRGIYFNLCSEYLDLTGFCEKFGSKVTIIIEITPISVDYVKTCQALVEMSNSGYFTQVLALRALMAVQSRS